MAEAGADAEEDGRHERPLAARAEEPPRAPEHEPDGRGVGEEPDARAPTVSRLRPRPWTAASATMNRKSVAPSTGFSPMFQTMPWPGRQVARVAHQHRGVLLGPPAQVERGPHVPADEEQQQEADRPVAPVEAGRALRGHQCVSALARADARQLR